MAKLGVDSDKRYEGGQKLKFKAETRDSAGVLTNPTNLKFRIKPPVSVEFTKTFPADAEVVNTATGLFEIEYTLLFEEGELPVRWEADGTIQNSTEDRIEVIDSGFY